MRSPAANRRVLANSLHHLPPGSVAKRKTNPNKWIELTIAVRRMKQLPDLSAIDDKRPVERKYMNSGPAADRIRLGSKCGREDRKIRRRSPPGRDPRRARFGSARTCRHCCQCQRRVRCQAARLQPSETRRIPRPHRPGHAAGRCRRRNHRRLWSQQSPRHASYAATASEGRRGGLESESSSVVRPDRARQYL